MNKAVCALYSDTTEQVNLRALAHTRTHKHTHTGAGSDSGKKPVCVCKRPKGKIRENTRFFGRVIFCHDLAFSGFRPSF